MRAKQSPKQKLKPLNVNKFRAAATDSFDRLIVSSHWNQHKYRIHLYCICIQINAKYKRYMLKMINLLAQVYSAYIIIDYQIITQLLCISVTVPKPDHHNLSLKGQTSVMICAFDSIIIMTYQHTNSRPIQTCLGLLMSGLYFIAGAYSILFCLICLFLKSVFCHLY